MKLPLLAAGMGLALAAALLGLGLHGADSAGAPARLAGPVPDTARAGISAEKVKLIGPGAHEDGNRARKDYLNQNVIDGVTTRVCAADAAMHTALGPAIQAWNDADRKSVV